MGWRRPSQPFQSPTTLTRRALGAHTTKRTPLHPLVADGMRAEPLEEAIVGALAEQVQIVVVRVGGKR